MLRWHPHVGIPPRVSQNVLPVLGSPINYRHPFLLPNLIGAVGALLLLPIVVLFVPETKYFDELRAAEIASTR